MASRKYVDLIYRVSGKYTNWDPIVPIEVGDYGAVNRQTGQFEREGNVYVHSEAAALVADYPLAAQGDPDNMNIVSSANVKHLDSNVVSINAGPSAAEASIKGRWEFNNRPGALLIIVRPRNSFLPKEVLKSLSGIPSLRDKAIVTQASSCPAYLIYLSNGARHTIDVSLLGSTPLPNVPASSVGRVEWKWQVENTSGFDRSGCDPDGAYSYTLCFDLRAISVRRRFFEHPVPKPEVANRVPEVEDNGLVQKPEVEKPIQKPGDETPVQEPESENRAVEFEAASLTQESERATDAPETKDKSPVQEHEGHDVLPKLKCHGTT